MVPSKLFERAETDVTDGIEANVPDFSNPGHWSAEDERSVMVINFFQYGYDFSNCLTFIWVSNFVMIFVNLFEYPLISCLAHSPFPLLIRVVLFIHVFNEARHV